MEQTLPESYLMLGAFYAMEQAGHLLRDATLLFNRRRYASSFALASFTQEEMGKAAIIEECASKVRNGDTVTPDWLNQQLREGRNAHRHKLKRGQGRVKASLGLYRRAPKKSLNLFARFKPKVNEPRRVSIEELISAIDESKGGLANDTLDARKRSLYVDPVQGYTGWNRPVEATRDEALDLLITVGLDYRDYRACYRRLQRSIERSNGFGYNTWPARPNLPRPVFPSERPRA